MNYNNDNLQDHIDAPILRSVVGMALLGLNPAMSCCGFTYRGEKVEKKHLGNKCYMYLECSSWGEKQFSLMCFLARSAHWVISPVGKGRNFEFLDFYLKGFDPKHPWYEECPHSHEMNVMGLKRLEEAIDHKREFFYDQAYVKDGNEFYQEDHKFWQYLPCKPWEVSPKTFDQLA